MGMSWFSPHTVVSVSNSSFKRKTVPSESHLGLWKNQILSQFFKVYSYTSLSAILLLVFGHYTGKGMILTRLYNKHVLSQTAAGRGWWIQKAGLQGCQTSKVPKVDDTDLWKPDISKSTDLWKSKFTNRNNTKTLRQSTALFMPQTLVSVPSILFVECSKQTSNQTEKLWFCPCVLTCHAVQPNLPWKKYPESKSRKGSKDAGLNRVSSAASMMLLYSCLSV